MKNIEKARFLISHQGKLLRFFKLAFTKKDASFYIFPYAQKGKFYFGNSAIPSQQINHTINYQDGSYEEQIPKLSIHESGQVHISPKSHKVQPLMTLPLKDFRGQHIATVCSDSFDILPMFNKTPSTSRPEVDYVIPTGNNLESGRFAIYLNGENPEFAGENCLIQFKLQRPTLQNPLYIGIMAIPQLPVGIDAQTGVTVISGWNPNISFSEAAEFLYIRGE